MLFRLEVGSSKEVEKYRWRELGRGNGYARAFESISTSSQ